MNENIITVRNFNKVFGKTEVIKDLSFEVKSGEIFAFLGANGSGKTTTLRSLLGILQPTSGELLVNGHKFTQKDTSILGYLPEERGLYLSSKVLETMVYFGELKGVEKSKSKEFSLKYLEKVELLDKANTLISKLSSGQQQKIQLGITIINNPKLLILDEPTKGLDPVNRSLLLDILLDMNKNGATIVFSTHQMEEVEKIADRLLMIKNGKSLLCGDINEIKRSFGNNSIRLSYEGEFKENADLFSANVETNEAQITPHKGVTPQEILKFLVSVGIQINRFEVTTPSLNDIFIKVYKENE